MPIPAFARLCLAVLLLAALSVLAHGGVPQGEGRAPRTVGREQECRPGLCPHIRRLSPDLSHAPPHIHQLYGRSEFSGELSLCGNLCTHDKTCPSHQKCCPTTCGYACQDIVHIHEDY